MATAHTRDAGIGAVIEATEVELQNRGLDLAERFFEERPRDFGHRLGAWLQQWLGAKHLL